jgi:hypothetical protein
MTRKKAQKKQQLEKTTLMPHRTSNLSSLLERAKGGNAAQAVKAYLHAGGSAKAFVQTEAPALQQMPLLHHMAFYNLHPHKELCESVRLLIEAGADINAKSSVDHRDCTALVCASGRRCCSHLSAKRC